MKTVSLALRNLLRNRRRSLTTLLAMIIGASSILLFGGYSRNAAVTCRFNTRIISCTAAAIPPVTASPITNASSTSCNAIRCWRRC